MRSRKTHCSCLMSLLTTFSICLKGHILHMPNILSKVDVPLVLYLRLTSPINFTYSNYYENHEYKLLLNTFPGIFSFNISIGRLKKKKQQYCWRQGHIYCEILLDKYPGASKFLLYLYSFQVVFISDVLYHCLFCLGELV